MDEGRRLRRDSVTSREAEVLAALSDNLTNAEIAERLFISVRTVESHVSALLRKLGKSDRRALAAFHAELVALAPDDAVPLPFPEALADVAGRGTFAGRLDERAVIGDAITRVAEGGRQHLVLVVGESGIGKTRLLAETAVGVHGAVRSIAFGRCDEEALVPYQPFAEAFAAFVDQVAPDLRERVAPATAALLSQVAPNAPPPIATADPAQARRQVLLALEDVIAGLAPPALVIIDDVQWADRPTLLVVKHLLRAARRLPLLLAATARSESLRPESELAELLAALDPDDVTLIELRGLGADQVEALVSADFPDATAMASDAWARTEGHPLLLRELLRQVVESGATSLEEIPPRVRELVARRIARLEPTLVQVLTAGALMGESFRLGVAARAVDESPNAVLDALDTAVRGGIVSELAGEPDRYRFAHAVVRDALVQRQTSSRRLHLHLRIAEEIERSGSGSVLELAHHRHAALPEGDTRAAIEAARAAAEQAMFAVAYEREVTLRGMVIDALLAAGGPEHEEGTERMARAQALMRAGEIDAARADLLIVAEFADRIGDAEMLARAALGLGDIAPRWGLDTELVALLEAALDALGPDEIALRGRVTARLAQALYYSVDGERRRELVRRAEADARLSDDAESLAWVLSAEHDALWSPDDVATRAECARNIVALGQNLGHTELELRGHGLLVVDLIEAGRFGEARGATARHAALADELNQPVHRRDAEAWRAMWALTGGDYDEAERAIMAVHELSDAAGDPHGDLLYWIQQYGVGYSRGEARELDELVTVYERLSDELPHVPAWRSALAAIHVRRGDRDAVAAIFEEQAADNFSRIPRDVVWLNAFTYLAHACAFLGDADRAAVLYTELEPYSGLVVSVDRALFCKGAVAHWLGMLDTAMGNVDRARRWLEQAYEMHRAGSAALLAEQTASELARLG